MVDQVAAMIAAVIVSVGLMMLFAAAIRRFVSNHPTVKMLALSFLMIVGVALVAQGFGHKVPKGYIYFAMAFAVLVEMLNIRTRTKRVAPVHLREAYRREQSDRILPQPRTNLAHSVGNPDRSIACSSRREQSRERKSVQNIAGASPS
jgi:hypothetical protein